jgi:hypothetical protein
MLTCPGLYRCLAVIALALMISAVAVQAQSGISSAGGVVADETATRKGNFVGVIGAKVELEQNVKDSPRKFTTTADNRGVYSFREIPYGHYVLRVSAPGYRSYELKFFVDSDGSADITVLLWKTAN